MIPVALKEWGENASDNPASLSRRLSILAASILVAARFPSFRVLPTAIGRRVHEAGRPPDSVVIPFGWLNRQKVGKGRAGERTKELQETCDRNGARRQSACRPTWSAYPVGSDRRQ